ncbi:DUF2846 domain-containing protein [Rhodoferax sp. AJA081-3]|uniref:DUF2846 domain-containing protein n=1 Tax=Rhodoferax sp. AJA081-3 TaxID=2752316 RepID=UPI001ADFECF3|nr:DUF2846 domain-containing protein [Rhodoferax sp. AJA081-3]QTN26213.1 DUF2846 domain-containing protein [Rhodoferax sp. AJA081-3]
MQSFLRFAIVSAFVFSVTACATVAQGPSYSESKAKTLQSDRSTVYIFRKYAEPTAFGTTIKINGTEVTSLNQNGYTWATVAPGTTEIRAVWAGLSGQRDSLISLNLKPATTYFIELTGMSKFTGATLGGGSGVTMQEFNVQMGSGLNHVNPAAAEKVLEACCKFQKPNAIHYQ